MPGEEDFSRFDDSAPLIRSDRPFELLGTHVFPGFHLREGDDALAGGGDIDLAAPPAEVPGDDRPALRLEEGGGDVFAGAALRGGASREAHRPGAGLLAGELLGIEGAGDEEGLFGYQVDESPSSAS